MDAGDENQARGVLLAKARKDLGKRQEDIANECEVTQPTVSAWEGGALPELTKVRIVAAAYGVSPLLFLPALPKAEKHVEKTAKRKRAGA